MAVDVSGLTSMLATSPGQNMANLQNTLEQAYRDKQAAEQRQFQNDMLSQKAHLDQQVAQGKLNLEQLDRAAKQGQFAASWAQSLDTAQDPLQKQALVQQGLAQAQQLGIPPEGIAAMQKAAQDPAIAKSLIARAVSTNEYYKSALAGTTNKSESEAGKKYNDLIALAKQNGTYVPGVTEKVSEGMAFGAYHTSTDPTTGDVIITDVRSAGRVSPQTASQIQSMGGVPKPDTNYSPMRITSGNKQEMKIQDRVQELSGKINGANIPDMEAMLQPLEATIRTTGTVPGFGLGSSLMPDVFVDQQTKDFRQNVKRLFDTVLKIRSGSAVVQQELDRLKDEYGVGNFKTASQLMHAISSARSVLEEEKKSIFAGYDPSITQRYMGQGGVTLQGGQTPEEKTPQTTPKRGGPPTSAAQVRADAKKYGWNEDQIQATLKRFNLKD